MRADFKSLLARHVEKFSCQGVERSGNCPFHKDTTQSFSVNIDTGLWFCHSCNSKGNAYQFAKLVGEDPTPYRNGFDGGKIDNMTLSTGKTNNGLTVACSTMEVDPDTMKLALKYNRHLLDNFSTIKHPIPWLIEVVKNLLIGYCEYESRFTFPHFNESGKVINIKYHKSESGEQPYSIPGHGENRLYPLNLLNDYDPDQSLIYCEGEKDCVTLISQGFQAVTNTTGAGSIPRDLSPLNNVKHIPILLDNDIPGKNGSIKNAEALKAQFPEMKVDVIHWLDRFPDKYDVTDFFTTEDPAEFEEILSNVQDFTSELQQNPSPDMVKPLGIIPQPLDFYDYVNDDRSKPEEMIDGILPVESIMGIVSDPGVGKTILAMNLSIHLAGGNNWFDRKINFPQRVLYLIAEGGYWSLRERIKKMSNYDIQLPRDSFIIFPVRPFDLMDITDIAQVEGLLNDFSPDVFVIDTFIKCHHAEENDNGAMQRVMDVIRSMVTGKGRSAIICHHSAKSGGTRGATAVQGDLDTVIKLGWKIKSEHDHSRNLVFDKIRHGELLNPMTLDLNPETLFFEQKKDPLSNDDKTFMDYFNNGAKYTKAELIKKLEKDTGRSNSTCYTIFKKNEINLVQKLDFWYEK
ncbi:MAG: AAA family ATPase [Candidatus Marinimicrobia bacterium]|nr:AAA family ATPase [Candidatus Neomarinimicrobiota bacterium]